MVRKVRMLVAGCAAAVVVVLTTGTTASADSGTDGTRITGTPDHNDMGPDTRELGPDTRELGVEGVEDRDG